MMTSKERSNKSSFVVGGVGAKLHLSDVIVEWICRFLPFVVIIVPKVSFYAFAQSQKMLRG